MKNILKTTKEWFEELSEPQRTLAINNSTGKKLQSKEISLPVALTKAFVWVHTTEGHVYWEELYLNLTKNGE